MIKNDNRNDYISLCNNDNGNNEIQNNKNNTVIIIIIIIITKKLKVYVFPQSHTSTPPHKGLFPHISVATITTSPDTSLISSN